MLAFAYCVSTPTASFAGARLTHTSGPDELVAPPPSPTSVESPLATEEAEPAERPTSATTATITPTTTSTATAAALTADDILRAGLTTSPSCVGSSLGIDLMSCALLLLPADGT